MLTGLPAVNRRRTSARIAVSGLATTCMLSASLVLVSTAHATPTFDGCAEVDYVLPVGETATLSFATCTPFTGTYFGSAYTNGIHTSSGTPVIAGSTVTLTGTGDWVYTRAQLPSTAYITNAIAACGEMDPVNYPQGSRTLDISACSSPPAPSESAGTGPAHLIQQVSMPHNGCSDIQVPGLNWAGVGSAGWGASWAEWANEGRGGAVCSRTLQYSANVGAWLVLS